MLPLLSGKRVSTFIIVLRALCFETQLSLNNGTCTKISLALERLQWYIYVWLWVSYFWLCTVMWNLIHFLSSLPSFATVTAHQITQLAGMLKLYIYFCNENKNIGFLTINYHYMENKTICHERWTLVIRNVFPEKLWPLQICQIAAIVKRMNKTVHCSGTRPCW